MSEEIKFPYIDFYYADWRSGCAGMTAQQEGLYSRLFCHLGLANGKGLPNDFNFIFRMVCDPTDDLAIMEQQKEDLMWVITHKLALVDGRYHQLVQKKRREDKIDIARIRQETGKKGGLAKAKQTSSKDSVSVSIYNNIWEQLLIKRGSKSEGLKFWLRKAKDVQPDTLIEKYNALCRQADDPKFIPHFATWLNHERWEEELPVKKETDNFGVPQKKSHKDYVGFVKKGIRSTSISDDMVRQMRTENLITEEEFKRW